MKAVVRFLLGLGLAAAFYALALRFHPRSADLFDPFLVLVVYHGLRHAAGEGPHTSPLAAAVVGSLVGLAQDTLTGGLFGLHAFADTLVGWTVAKVQRRMVIQQPLQIALAGLLASAFQLAVLASLQFFMVPGSLQPEPLEVAGRMVLCGALVAAVHLLALRFRRAERRWRERRSRRLRFDL